MIIRRLFQITVLGIALFVSGCNRLEKTIVGTWTTGDQLTEYDFRSNGTGLLRSGFIVSPFTYDIHGNQIGFDHTGPISKILDHLGLSESTYRVTIRQHSKIKIEFLDVLGYTLYKKDKAFDIEEALK